MQNDKKFRALAIAAICVAIVGVSVAYAALSASLTITGTAKVDTAASWNVFFSDVAYTASTDKSAGVTVTTAPTVTGTSTTSISWAATFTAPGDYLQYTVTAKNSGTINAVLTSMSNTVGGDLSQYFTYEVTVAGETVTGSTLPTSKRLLNAGKTATITVKVTFDKEKKLSASDLSGLDSTKTATFTSTFGFAQATSADSTYTSMSA